MTIKLIALDLDGTTLNKSGRLSARTKAALEEAAFMWLLQQAEHSVRCLRKSRQ